MTLKIGRAAPPNVNNALCCAKKVAVFLPIHHRGGSGALGRCSEGFCHCCSGRQGWHRTWYHHMKHKISTYMIYGWKSAASKLMGKLDMLPEEEPHGLALVLYCAVVERGVSFPGLPVQRWGVLDNEVHQVEPLPAVDIGTRHGRYSPVQRQWCKQMLYLKIPPPSYKISCILQRGYFKKNGKLAELSLTTHSHILLNTFGYTAYFSDLKSSAVSPLKMR